ncbi:hypothetical protein [Rhizobium sp. NFR07]|uniref:hypothetical protein n=1 Tax=Rhizobium sp. NFR07 TaxID=1566262 RepID=UPI001160A9D9|nr:hypothetical protein [Rhizobium sp. NFR07]
MVTAKRGKHSDAAAFPDLSVQAAIAFIISKTGKDSVNANLSLFRDGTVSRICLFAARDISVAHRGMHRNAA